MGYGSGTYGSGEYGGGSDPLIQTDDSFVVSDSVSFIPGRVTADSWSVSDSLTRTVALERATHDQWPSLLGDSFSRTVALGRATADSWSIADSLTRAVVLMRAMDDGWSIADVLTRAVALARATDDGWSMSETNMTTVALERATADSWTVGDALRFYWAPYADLPTQNPIQPGRKTLAIERSSRRGTVQSGRHGLPIEPTPKELALDG